MPSRPPDPRRPDSVAAIREFAGMASNADPHDLAGGRSRVQVNATAARPGELATRGGLRPLAFEE